MDIERLRRLPEEELMQLHNEEPRHRAAPPEAYLHELARREAVRQGERIEELNWSINHLTWVVTGAAILIAILTALAPMVEG